MFNQCLGEIAFTLSTRTTYSVALLFTAATFITYGVSRLAKKEAPYLIPSLALIAGVLLLLSNDLLVK